MIQYVVTAPDNLLIVKKEEDRWLLRFDNSLTQLNNSGAYFLKVASLYNDVDSAVDALLMDVKEDRDTIREHFINFIQQLKRLGLCNIFGSEQVSTACSTVKWESNSNWTQSLTSPVYISWHLTAECTLNCNFCYSRKRKGTLSFSHSLHCADALIDAGVLDVSFGGGESLLVPYFSSVAKRLTDAGLRVSFITHGGLEIDRFLSPVLDIPFSRIGVSLDSASEFRHDKIRGSGVFRSVIKSARRIVEAGHSLRIVTVLTSDNAHEATEIARLASDLGADEVQFKQLKHVGISSEKAKRLDLSLAEKKEVWGALMEIQSAMPKTNINIGKDSDPIVNRLLGDGQLLRCNCGSVSACLREDGSVTACAYAGKALGSLLSDTLVDIWTKSSALRQQTLCMTGQY